MIEIRFHGRGGQGAVVASNILANAAFLEGMDVKAFPYFGVERRGAPVTAFTRMSEGKIGVRSEIYEPDHVIVLDVFLLQVVDVTAGYKGKGIVLLNTEKPASSFDKLKKVSRVITIDATGIAVKHKLGTTTNPILNTAILGGFAGVSKVVKKESLIKAIDQLVPQKKKENIAAAEEAYACTSGGA